MDGLACRTCGETNPVDARLCGMCGTSLLQDEAAGEVRRVITLVTSDLKGSTALGERLDPEALREVLNRYFDVMRAVFESHGGTIEKIIGDAIVAVFGLPFRHDDDPLRAMEAAAESQRALATLNDELDAGYGVRLVVRTGVATGEVTFGASEAGQHVLLGPAVDISTVMEQNSPPFEVLVHQSTQSLVGDAAVFEAAPPASPKGSDEQFVAFRLVSVHDRADESETVIPDPLPGMRICPSCGEQSPDRMRLCNTCGAALSQVVARESRRTVTIVFAMPKVHSLSGEAPGPETMRDVMSAYFDGMRRALERHGGTVEKFIGDAVMAVFGLPVRHEDDAVRAIRAAADMQTALNALNPAFRTESGLELSNHIGVNSGEVIAGDASTAQRMVTGDAVNTAARLEQAAGSGEVVLGDLTYRLARNEIEVDFMEPLVLKGKAEPVPAYRLLKVIDKSVADAGTGTPFVGREVEMGRLAEALDAAVNDRRAQLVTVVGDAGVGKSRLIREFATRTAQQARLVRGRCLPYGDGITFWPIAEVVREAAGITNEDTPRVAIRRIDRLLERTPQAEEREAIVARVAAAMNLSAAQFPVPELMWGCRRILEALTSMGPAVVLVDDLHWAEATFLEFLDYLLETMTESPLLILGSTRHEITERHAEWAESHAPLLITLTPLSDADAGKIVEELLGALDESVRLRIATAAEGNPLYVEQIVSMLVETGALQRGMEGWVAREGSNQLQIPPTVQALVASRLDALKAEERAVVDPASVVGLSFPVDALSELVDDEVRPRLGDDLNVLVGKQLVRRLPDEDVIYRFGHQIIRDTAYGSLLKRSRAMLHEKFVTWADRTNRERGRELEFEEILGYHLEQAFQYRTSLGVVDAEAITVGEQAATKLSSAGRRALARGDLPAAVSLLRRSTALLPETSTFRVELLIDTADGLLQEGSFDAVRVTLTEASAIAESNADQRLVARAEVLRAGVDSFTGGGGGPNGSLAAIGRVIGALEASADDAGLARAWRVSMLAYITLGQLEQASAAADKVILHATRAGERRLASRSASLIGYILVHGPTPVGEAIERCLELKRGVEGDRKTAAIVDLSLAQLYAMRGDFAEAREAYRASQTVLTELGRGIDGLSTSIESARIELMAGDLATAESELRRDDAALKALDETYFRSTVDGMLAQVLAARGDIDGADEYATTAKELTEDGDVVSEVLWRGARARVLIMRGEVAEAEQVAHEAVTIVRETDEISLLGDAFAEHANALAVAGRRDEALAALESALGQHLRKGDLVSETRIRGLLPSDPIRNAESARA